MLKFLFLTLQKKTIVGSIYKHPLLSLDEFNKLLEPLLNKINKENKHVLLLGDFNINLLNAPSDQNILSYMNNFGSHFLIPNIFLPTRITDHSMTLIDNIFSTISEQRSFSGNLLYSISDHLPQFYLICGPSQKPKAERLYRQDWKNFNQDNFILNFLDIDWADKLYNITNVDQAFKTFYDLIQNLIAQHVPTVVVTKRQQKTSTKPWITPGIIKSISNRQFYFRKFIQSKDPIMKSFYHHRYKT